MLDHIFTAASRKTYGRANAGRHMPCQSRATQKRFLVAVLLLLLLLLLLLAAAAAAVGWWWCCCWGYPFCIFPGPSEELIGDPIH